MLLSPISLSIICCDGLDKQITLTNNANKNNNTIRQLSAVIERYLPELKAKRMLMINSKIGIDY